MPETTPAPTPSAIASRATTARPPGQPLSPVHPISALEVDVPHIPLTRELPRLPSLAVDPPEASSDLRVYEEVGRRRAEQGPGGGLVLLVGARKG